ncbi:MAG: hypothetical protein EBY29_17835 [Planctomycetes bacterium]|nr:hypothetical protein [Planctomycetota bacterium]
MFVGVTVDVLVFVGVGSIIIGQFVDVGVEVSIGVGEIVEVGVTEGLGVFVIVGVIVTVGVFVGVDMFIVKVSIAQSIKKQSGQSGLNMLNLSFNNLKLCLISGADNGSTYILN